MVNFGPTYGIYKYDGLQSNWAAKSGCTVQPRLKNFKNVELVGSDMMMLYRFRGNVFEIYTKQAKGVMLLF